MSWLRTIGAELVGLFVDDGSLAISVLVWIALCWAVLPRLGLPPLLPPLILFAGLALILVENTLRGARRRG